MTVSKFVFTERLKPAATKKNMGRSPRTVKTPVEKATKRRDGKVSEKAVKARVREILISMGIWYCTPIGAGFGPAAHDFICCVQVRSHDGWYGQLVSIETKASDGKPRPRQLETAKAIQASSGIVLFVYPDDVLTLRKTLEEIQNGWVPPVGA